MDQLYRFWGFWVHWCIKSKQNAGDAKSVVARRNITWFLLIPETHCLSKTTEKCFYIQKVGKAWSSRSIHTLLPSLDIGEISGCGSTVSSPGSIRRCLCTGVLPRSWIVGTERDRVDAAMGTQPLGKYHFFPAGVVLSVTLEQRSESPIFELL